VARTSTLLKRLQPPHRSERPDPYEPLAIVLVSELNRVIDTSVVINDASSGGSRDRSG
jgi:hypothetical protein